MISTSLSDESNGTQYHTERVVNHPNYFIGRDAKAFPCLLIDNLGSSEGYQSPIRLEYLEVQFAIYCLVRTRDSDRESGFFTVLRCRTKDQQVIKYFLFVCEMLIRIIGDLPNSNKISSAVNRIAKLFQQIRKPPTRSINGLFGELFFINQCSNVGHAVFSWRIEDSERFDFTDGAIRIDVKASTGRDRVHQFSYDQCNPPANSIAVVVSILTEQTSGGLSLGQLVRSIEDNISFDSDLILKLHDTIAATLGNCLTESLSKCFDDQLANSTLKYYDLRDIPAIRGELPRNVRNVKFSSDLSNEVAVVTGDLVERVPSFVNFLPQAD